MDNLATDLEFWMTKLPEKLRKSPVIHLAIPGSHDSTTYAINKTSKISPDARQPIQFLKFLEPLLRPAIIRWSKTQSADITQQLNAGIRYFDLRIALKPHCQNFYFVHNLYSECINSILTHINDFLEGHPDEIVILDCQHFFNLSLSDHKRLVTLLMATFGVKLLPYSHSMAHITLDYMKERSRQILLIYRADVAIKEDSLWPGVSFPTPWPDTVEISSLVKFLNRGLAKRNCTLGFVSQCVLTPTVWYALKNVCSSLRSTCVLPLEVPKYEWLQQQQPGNRGLNVVISDFVEYQDFQFSKEVINLNHKLL